MLKKITIALLFGLISNISLAASEFALLQEERIGSLRIDQAEQEVKKAISCTAKRGPDQKWEADGAYHQKWSYAGCGITLDMVSDKKGTAKRIGAITLTAPSTLSTRHGIRIGSKMQEVMQAYKPYWNKEESDANNFVAGSIYGGLIITPAGGKVSQIFLGAIAE
jgi:hypothetical protein